MTDKKPTNSSDGLDARRAALDILERIRNGVSLDEALRQCRTYMPLQGADRAFARALATNVLRRRGALDAIIDNYIDKPLPARVRRIIDILRLAGAQTLLMETPPHAAVSTAVTLASERRETAGYAKLVNAVSRKIAAGGPESIEKVSLRAETPGWLWRSWERRFGPAQARAIAKAHQSEPPLDITVKNDAQGWAEKLEGIALSDQIVRLAKAPRNVDELVGFNDGEWWVQDAAASLPVLLLSAIANKSVYDVCAAPGGKTMQLAAAGAKVTAVDISEPRLERVSENLARTKLSANLICEDFLKWQPAEKADAILLDAPCSATGTVRRHPEIPWRKTQTDIDALKPLQARMLDHAYDLLKPGGVLVYCVCSLQPDEAEDQIKAFLERSNAEHRSIEPNEIPIEGAVSRNGDLRTFPSMLAETGGMDGFFAARVVKKG